MKIFKTLSRARSSTKRSQHIWVRDEYKPSERRCALTPETASVLLKNGFKVTIESSTQRVFKDEEFQSVGCEIAKSHSWVTAPKQSIILGLKEIPTPHEKKTIPHALQHRHVFFAHSYKYQSGWKDTLARFTSGGGEILDLEYLVYDDGKRVAAFGKEAGFAGAALSLMVWANQKINGLEHVYPAVKSYNYKSELIEEIKGLLKTVNANPSVLVIGSKGRVGTGSLECFYSVGLNDVIQWNSSDTSQPGPYLRIAQVDVCVNAILLSPHKPKNIFLDMATVERANRDQSRKLTVLGDVSCDCSNPKNPFPMSDHCTSFSDPVNRIKTTGLPLDVISIDHLPTMVPREASQEFSKLLLPHLLTLKNFTFEKKNVDNENVRIWQRARDLFHAKIHE